MQSDQGTVLKQLCSADAYSHRTSGIRRIETHISWVYLTGRFAYKIKKAVKLPYLDFSTLEQRKRACEAELILNRRLAPEIYHEVVSIGGEHESIRLGGTPVVEYAVKMTQFPDGSIASQLLQNGELSASHLAQFARVIAAFHQQLAPSSASPPGTRILSNLSELNAAGSDSSQRLISKASDWVRTSVDRLSGYFAAREAAGKIRECHGDLHLGNIVRIDGQLVAFDCLEFSRDLRTIDVIDELAFLFMDLLAHQRPDLAFGYLNGYLDITGDYEGLRGLRLYSAHRALVRAKVAMAGTGQEKAAGPTAEVARYIETAVAQTRAVQPLCLISFGLSGSGKTTIARQLVDQLEAVHMRSDVERKRMHDMQPTDNANARPGQGIYDTESSVATYSRLASLAEAALAGGISVIVDASFISRSNRDLFRSKAAECGASFVILNCAAPTELLRTRILERSQRRNDASDADRTVLDHQLKVADAIGDDEQAFTVTVQTDQSVNANQLAREIRTRGAQVSLSSTSS